MKVAVLGPGLMGSQIAVEYALGGHDVVALARRPDVAAERIERAFSTLASHALASAEQLDAARQHLAIEETVETAAGAEIIVESVVEDLDEKAAALAPVMAVAPDAIIATNTSAIPISAIGAAIQAPQRTIGAHYWNPPLLMPLVEVIRGAETSADTATEMTTILRQLGKRPVLVDRDVPGFAWNRLQLALLREAVWLVENGVASPATVDEIVRDGLARRWRFTGPFQTAALGGPATFERVANNLWPELSCATSLHDLRRWLDEDPATTTPLRERRDDGLVNELLHDRDRQSEGDAVSGLLPNVEPIRREPLVSEIARRLVDYLLSGGIEPGARIPSERQLAEAFGVARSAVREAIAALTLIGLIEVRHGDGTYLKRPESPLLPQVIEWGLLLGEQRTADLVEARQKIEVIIAGLAAQRRTDDDLSDLARILRRMEREANETGDSAAFVDADVEFHLRLAETARNSALRDVLSSIQALLRTWIGRVTAEGNRDVSYAEHVPVLEAVRARDAQAAERAMGVHMSSAAQRLQETLDRASRHGGLSNADVSARGAR